LVQTLTWCSIMIKGRHVTMLQGDPIWGSGQHHLQTSSAMGPHKTSNFVAYLFIDIILSDTT
jgi:hypothetical protein